MGIYGRVQKFGRIPTIGSSDTDEDLWDGEGAYPFLSTAAEMTISSSSADDDAAGTGALTVRWFYLDADWNIQSVDITTNGQTAASTTITCIRIFRGYVLTAGSGGTNAGDLWAGTGALTNGVPAVKHAGIKVGMGQTLMAIFSIPVDAVGGGQITRWYGTCGAGQSAYATIALQTREYGEAWRTRRVSGIGEGGWMTDEITWGVTVGTKADIRIRALTNGVNSSTIEAGFDLELLDA